MKTFKFYFLYLIICVIKSQNVILDIFAKENSEYLDLLKENVVTQINETSATHFYSVVDC